MKSRVFVFTLLMFGAAPLFAAEATHKLETVKKAPEGISKQITSALDPNGYRISGPKGTVCEIWLAKNLAFKPKFKPSLSVKYPFTPGQFVGALRVPEKVTYTDFRGQELKAGVYTLRYGKQPEDGNHVGTSDLADFILALPSKVDADTKTITDFDTLSEKSAGSAGSTHPAIFSLLPAEKTTKAAKLSHDEEHDYWILQVAATGKQKDKSIPIALRMIAVGRSPE